jgi:hypothetical protein
VGLIGSIIAHVAKSNSKDSVFEVASTGSCLVKLNCENLGIWSVSKIIRFHKSACKVSSWTSESAIICKPHMVSKTFGTVVISDISTFSSYNSTLSLKISIVGNSSNVPFTGSSILSILGVGFFAHESSIRVRFAGSACDTTNWKSDSNTNAKAPKGKGSFNIAISLENFRIQDDTREHVFDFEDFSFLPFFYKFHSSVVYPSTGSLEMNLIGVSASNEDLSGKVRLR